MSALEQTALPQSTERRGAPRLRINSGISVLIGRGEGFLVDLSERGARVRHSGQVRRNSNVRFSFEWEGSGFSATAEVLSSHVVTLGHNSTPTIYESRLRFRLVTEEASALLKRVLSSRETYELRRWIATLRGSGEAIPPDASPRPTGSYLRCRLIGHCWERKWTHSRTQPNDGFLLPEAVETRDVDNLCRAYEDLDEDGRQLIRLIAASAITA